MFNTELLTKINSYEVKDEEIEKEASTKTEEEITKEAALEKFASLPLNDALEILKPVVKVASFKESLGGL